MDSPYRLWLMDNLAMKDKVLARIHEPDTKMDHYYLSNDCKVGAEKLLFLT
jgi:hypothetical protein